jgi:hypothetical protein
MGRSPMALEPAMMKTPKLHPALLAAAVGAVAGLTAQEAATPFLH